MSEFVNSAHELIKAAKVAIAAPREDPPPLSSALLARIIVNEAKKQRPNDAAIQSIDLEGETPDWNEISAAMNIIVKALG